MSLKKYNQKRDFTKTTEPKGRAQKGNSHLFIIQKHAASHLHYDFRIELNGVLKSWAVPKGPCLDPKVKRLAMHVEDHPIEYGTFEGTIPKGEYGGGTVLLWDKGIWKPLDENPLQAYEKGHLRFELVAEKLKGRWDLIRFKSAEQSNSWFLIKHKDEYALSGKEGDITTLEPDSVASGQSLEEIAEQSTAVWTREGRQDRRPSKKTIKFKATKLSLPVCPFPSFIPPQLATLVDKAPIGDDWAHEIKYDGYRILAFKKGKHVTLVSRNKKDWTAQFQRIADAIKTIPLGNVILDGELVLLDDQHHSNFQLLQNSVKGDGKGEFIYYLFDVLYYDKWDVRSLTLLERKALLPPLIEQGESTLRFSDHHIGQGLELFERCCDMSLEGIISKRIDSTYISARSTSWVKVKCMQRQEFVIGGYTPPQGSRTGFGSLFLGVFDSHGDLTFCGNVGTGFTEKSLIELHKKLKKLQTPVNPFNSNPPGIKTATWVTPKLVAEVEFSQWTKDGRLRHPSFKGLREDKRAKQVIKENEMPLATVANAPAVLATANIKITHREKIVYPEDKLTKQDLVEYYAEISSYILPYISNRPLTLVRCPDNFKECFYQKHLNKSSSKALHPVPIESLKDHTIEDYVYLNDVEGLLGLVQMGVLEIHPWGSTIEKVELPDIIIFDLDPSPEVAWKDVVKAAVEIRGYLEDLDLRSFVKNTGGKGLHVVVPISPEHNWAVIKSFSELFAEFVQRQSPDNYVTNMSKAKRKGKIFLDYLRNQRNATAIAPYSTRARLHAPVATPLEWDELTHDISDTFYTVRTLPQRLQALKKDPWEDFFKLKQTLKIEP